MSLKTISIILFILISGFMVMNCTIIKQLVSKKYEIYPSTNVHGLYPCEMWYGNVFFADGASVAIPKNLAYSVTTVWGRAGKTMVLGNNKFAVPFPLPNENFTFYLSDASRKPEIPPDDIELIIFKDKYESLRLNYDRPAGGWKY